MAIFRDKPLAIPKSTVLGIADSVSESRVNLVKSDGHTTAKVHMQPCRKEGNKSLYRKLLQGMLVTCPEKLTH